MRSSIYGTNCQRYEVHAVKHLWSICRKAFMKHSGKHVWSNIPSNTCEALCQSCRKYMPSTMYKVNYVVKHNLWNIAVTNGVNFYFSLFIYKGYHLVLFMCCLFLPPPPRSKQNIVIPFGIFLLLFGCLLFLFQIDSLQFPL